MQTVIKKIKLSIVIVSYNSLDLLKNCIDSIIKHEPNSKHYEIIIVDNSTNNETFSYINLYYSDIKIIKNPNLGFGQANNVGAKASIGKYLFFLNPDTIFIEPIIDYIIDFFDSNIDFGWIGFKLLSKELRPNLSFYYINKNGILSNILIKIFNKINHYNHRNMFMSGADLAMRKEIFMKIGMFDENLFMYFEEPDLHRRFFATNYRSKFVKNKSIVHLEGKTSSDSILALRRRYTSLIYYHKKYNLNYKRYIKKEIRFEKLRLLFCYIFKKKQVEFIRIMISIRKEYLND